VLVKNTSDVGLYGILSKRPIIVANPKAGKIDLGNKSFIIIAARATYIRETLEKLRGGMNCELQ
ncbi:hypothetical protein ACTPEF_26220, partial [Clostridioides difficile]